MASEVNTASSEREFQNISTAAGLFPNQEQAERAIDALTRAGFSKQDIGVAVCDSGDRENSTKSGGFINKVRSMFSADERQEYESGNDLDVLHHMGLKDADADFYRSSLNSGGILVTVRSQGRVQEAQQILQSSGAERPGTRAVSGAAGASASTGTQRVQLLGEILRVHKERVPRGSVTLRKDVVTEQQQVEVPLMREELIIERHPVQGSEAVAGSFEPGKEVTVNLEEERVRVEKHPVVREQVDVGKRQVKETKRVADNVKHEELRIDREGDVNLDRTQDANSASGVREVRKRKVG